MLPVVAIVGRPNVGKSTLFNALTRTRDALVANIPGVTRDRQYGICQVGKNSCVLVDTGGLVSQAEGIDYLTARQVHQAIEEAGVVLFVVSARDGLTAADEEVAALLRRHGKEVILVANKIDGTEEDVVLADFASLGMGHASGVSAEHRRGLEALMSVVSEKLPLPEEDSEEEDDEVVRLAVLGRPNVGKSTLVNRLVGEERVMAFDLPGTTRDSISTPMERNGQRFELIDTAGVRRRSRVSDALEKFSVIKALQAMERAHVVLMMLDAREGLTDQDMTLLGHVLRQGKALVLALNKWDGMEEEDRQHVLDELDRRLVYMPWARVVRISALHGSGLNELMKAVIEAWTSSSREFSSSELTRVVLKAFEAHQPPMSQGRTAKLRYAHAGGRRPPRIIIHGSRTDTVPESYRRYLENTIVRHFKLRGTPISIEFRSGENPFKGRKNVLTERQKAKRRRLKKFIKGKSRRR
ncbi:MAG: ribosome biogenesis GTPase Der [Xanthomonadales bacterium]|nr:ribosome biogenesis GTPase Der [Gammaproteobacteria bacterium]NNL94608.1 ribosome biogenesis GTPase Der [Xanthomonadales bacterium]